MCTHDIASFEIRSFTQTHMLWGWLLICCFAALLMLVACTAASQLIHLDSVVDVLHK